MWQFQLPPPLDDRFRTFLGVLFSSVASVMSAFTILSIPWSVLRSSFSEDSTSAHCSNSRFSRLFVSSLSPFLLDLFLSRTSFLRRSPRNRTLLWRNPQLYWKGSLLFRPILCWSHFLQTLSRHKMLRWRYEEDLKQILPGTFTIIIKEYIFLVIPDVEIASRVKQEKVGPTFNPCPTLWHPCHPLQKTWRNGFNALLYTPFPSTLEYGTDHFRILLELKWYEKFCRFKKIANGVT